MALLEIENLTHRFGGLLAVSKFNLKIDEGSLVGLIGPNGAGKTTIFNIVSGFYKPSEGSVMFQGKSISGLPPHKVMSIGISRTFQNIRLWSTMTVKENMCISQHHHLDYSLLDAVLGRKKYHEREKMVRRRADEILEILNLEKYADEYPKNLPYGMQRRVEIGRALTGNPKLLLLDEPAAGMNPGDIGQLIDLIKWIRKEFKLTIWLIEHQMKVVMTLCENLSVLDFGECIAEGAPDDVKRNKRVIKAYLGDEEVAHA